MADLEEIYKEVLAEEQAKGVSAAVAEGRAKAARARAEAGSPHPKEPKWWPGAQPHLEGGEAAPEAAAPEAAEEPAEEAPAEAPAAAPEAAEEPAEEAPAEAPAAEETPAETAAEHAPEVPQEQTTAPEPAQPAAATASVPTTETVAPAAAATAAPEQKPSGVIHGTTTGTRLRPEDEATTEAQFEGQQAMYDRRKLIDELVGTGVPAVSASATGERRSPALALLYLLIPIMAIAFLLAQDDSAPAGGEEPPGNGGSGITLVAQNAAFDTDQLSLPADEPTVVTLDNQDALPHNLSIYEDDSVESDLFIGAEVAGGASVDYDVPALETGEYFFRCDLHPTSMTGTVTVE